MCAVCWVFCLFWFFVCFCKSTHLHLPQLRKSPSFCSFLKISLKWQLEEEGKNSAKNWNLLLRQSRFDSCQLGFFIPTLHWWNHPLFPFWECCKSESQIQRHLHLAAVPLRAWWCSWRSCAVQLVVTHITGVMWNGSELVAFNVFLNRTCLTSLGLHWAATAALFVQSLNIWSVSVIVEVGQALPSSASYRIRSLRWPRHGLKLFLIHTPCVGAGVSLGLVETLRAGGDLREGLGF